MADRPRSADGRWLTVPRETCANGHSRADYWVVTKADPYGRCLECRREKQRRHAPTEVDRQRARAAARRHKVAHPEQTRAHNTVARAVKAGLLVRPETCERCGASGDIQASHDDYSKRLEVEWLCRICHSIKDGKQATNAP